MTGHPSVPSRGRDFAQGALHILPMALGVLPVLSPIAALGIALIQVGAFVVHARRGEKPYLNMVVFAIAGATAVLGFFALAGSTAVLGFFALAPA